MSRELTFRVGAGVAAGLAAAIAGGLLWARAGLDYFGAWLSVPFSLVIAGFFWHVADEMRDHRRQYLAALESGAAPPPGGPPL